MVYAHAASEPDSMMEQLSCGNHGWFGGRRTQAPNALDNYFRAIDFIENNIDFPLGSDDDPIESYSFHQHIFYIFSLLLFALNTVSAVLAYMRKDTVAQNLTTNEVDGDKSQFLKIFIMGSIGVDAFFYVMVFFLSHFCY
jgi:hypothetical protein